MRKKPILLWATFICYAVLLFILMAYHEPWWDETHCWNLAKCSSSFPDLLHNMRYEGHPPLWYILLWGLAKLSHDFHAVQIMHYVIALSTVFLLLFASPFPMGVKMLIPFGYFFLFEYATITRNYALGGLIAFCMCAIHKQDFRGKWVLYYALLAMMSYLHLLSTLLALSIHLATFSDIRKEGKTALAHLMVGCMVILPSFWFNWLPSDGLYAASYWFERFTLRQVSSVPHTVLRAFVPIPAWWEYHFWNSHFLLDLRTQWPFLKWVYLLLSTILLTVAVFLLKTSRKALVLFLSNVFLTLLLALFLSPTNMRYVGFVMIGFAVANWFLFDEKSPTIFQERLLFALLTIQVVPMGYVMTREIKHPFSNACYVNGMLERVPRQAEVLTETWSQNAMNAFTDKITYCIDAKVYKCFMTFDKKQVALDQQEDAYLSGLEKWFNTHPNTPAYLLTLFPDEISSIQGILVSKGFRVVLLDSKTGSIQKHENFYLYEITP